MASRLVSLLVVVLAAALLADESAAQALTPQDLNTKAVQDANAAMNKLEAAVQDLRFTAFNATLQDRLVDSFLKAGGDKSTILLSVHMAAQDKKAYVRGLMLEAKVAAIGIKEAGREMKRASKAAGEPESVTQPAYQNSERVSEQMEERAEHTGEEGDSYIKTIYEAVAWKIKARFALGTATAEPAAAPTAKPAVNAESVLSAGAEPAPKKGETLSAGGPADRFNFCALVFVGIAAAASAAAGTRAHFRRRLQDPLLYPMLG